MNLELPENLVGTIASSTTTMIGNLSSVAALIGGIILAFFVIEMVIGALRKDTPSV